mgnify:CR=1 FL=1
MEFIHAENEKERFQNTLRAMIAGKPAIANAALWNLPKNVYGSINLLERIDEGKSIFGPYHYRIVQFKRAHDLKEHYALQVSLLNHILSDIQKYKYTGAFGRFLCQSVCRNLYKATVRTGHDLEQTGSK